MSRPRQASAGASRSATGSPSPPLARTSRRSTCISTQPDKLQHFASEPALTPPEITVNKTSKKARGGGDVLLTPLPSPVVHPESNNTVTIKPVGPGGPMIFDGAGHLVWFRQLAAPRGRRKSAAPALQRPPGPDLVGGHRHSGGVRCRRRRDREPLLQRDQGRPRGQRLSDGPARVPAHQGWGRPLHGVFADPGPPGGDARGDPLAAARRDRPGGRCPHRLGGLGVAFLRPHPARDFTGESTEQRLVRRLPYQRDPAVEAGPGADLGSGHLGRIRASTGRAAGSSGRSAARGATSASAQAPSSTSSTTRTCWAEGRISMFDDGAGPPMFNPFSRGIILQLNFATTRRRWCGSSPAPASTSAQSEGSVQTLPDGNVFVGFGSEPFFSEFSSRGKLLLDGEPPCGRRDLSQLPVPLERYAQDPARGCRPAHRAVLRLRLRELERRDQRRQAGACWRALAQPPWRGSPRCRRPASRPASTWPPRQRGSRFARSTRRDG